MSLEAALARHRQGDLAGAEQLYRHVLQSEPGNLQALNMLGIVALQRGQWQAAVELIKHSLALDPQQASAHMNLGLALRQAQRLEEALASFDMAVRVEPTSASALFNRGGLLMELNRFESAVADFDALLGLGTPDPEALTMRGMALQRVGRKDEALASIDQALVLQPGSPRALTARGEVLRELRRLDEALACHESALSLAPDAIDALCNRGLALVDLGRHAEAIRSYDQALRRNPRDARILGNRAASWLIVGDSAQALADCNEALRFNPANAAALFTGGVALSKLRRYEEALQRLDAALALDPGLPFALGTRFHCQCRIFRWDDAAQRRRAVVDGVMQGRLVDAPFSFLATSGNPLAQLQCARSYVARRFPPESARPFPLRGDGQRRVRVAYVSKDFRDHAVSRLMAGVFEQHDRSRFEIIAISLQAEEDSELGRRVKAAFDRFVVVTSHTDAQVAALMRELEVDIAIDLMGHTDGQRTSLFAHRAAPVQVNLLGYPGTMGAPYIDYIIADDFVIPADRQVDCAERVVYLPHSFQPNDNRRANVQRGPDRAAVQLPGRGFVWCSMNNSYKLTEGLFAIWMHLLRETPDSVLWMLAETPTAQGNLQREAQRQGIAPERLVFAARVSYEEHLARLLLADLFLDTTPFNGGATASDALWAGLPVLTCAGEAFASRMAGSLLRAMGLPELITHGLQQYQDRALELARAPERLLAMRYKLVEARIGSPLFDTARYCRSLESAFTTMVERSRAGEPPAGFAVQEPHFSR